MRQVWLLTLAQALAACGTIVLISFAGIVGTHIAPAPALATLPLSMSVVGVAATSLPAALLMQRIGRRRAFIGSALAAAVGALLAAWSIAQSAFWGLCAAALLLGSNMAFVHQYRFAAVEHVPPARAGKAVATVMLGTLVAAVVGPALGQAARDLGGWPEFTGSFVVLSGLLLAAAAVLTRIEDAPVTAPAPLGVGQAPLRDILGRPAYRFAVLCALTSYAVMSFIMTATPLSMHVHDGFSSAATTSVITAHLLGMYLPSLASPLIVARLGVPRMITAGVAINLGCIAIAAFAGHAYLHYFSALVLLGLGWNLMFVAATTLLTATYAPAERFRAQGFNDLAVFGSQAVASLLAGTAIETIGWEWLNLATVPLLLWVLWRARGLGDPQRAAAAASSRSTRPESTSR
jgi:MFS family permease